MTKGVLCSEQRDAQEVVVLGRAQDERMLDDLDDLADIRAYDQAGAAGEFVPAAVVDRLNAGHAPIRVWREYRGMTNAVLAERAAISRAYLSQLERGKRTPSLPVLRKLANALAVDFDDTGG